MKGRKEDGRDEREGEGRGREGSGVDEGKRRRGEKGRERYVVTLYEHSCR